MQISVRFEGRIGISAAPRRFPAVVQRERAPFRLPTRWELKRWLRGMDRISAHSYEDQLELDADCVEAMNDACERAQRVIADGDPKAVEALHDEFSSTWMFLMEEADTDSANFIAVVQGLLHHTVVESVAELKGSYLRAYKRLYNALQGMDWELISEKPHRQQASNAAGNGAQSGRRTEADYYVILGVAPTAEKSEIRSAYRQLALKFHPDVNQTPKAEALFLRIRKAYDVLSDPTSRKLYDKYGADGMEQRSGAHAGDGNADRFWDEFKPFKKQSRKTKARTAGLERLSDSESEDEVEPMTGDVVEYPLSDLIKAELQDGREKGVGLLVGRNKDRGDAAKLPPELLGMCEIEPLRQETANSTKWIPDEIGCAAFCKLSELEKVAVDSYDGRFDVWVITVEFSVGCGGPEIVEEIVL